MSAPEPAHHTRIGQRWDAYVEVPPWATRVVLAFIVLVHALTGTYDHGRGLPWSVVILGVRSEASRLAYGARGATEVGAGEVWRLVTCGFVHVDLVHLTLNGLALASVGHAAEVVFGPATAGFVFLISVVGGGLLSQGWGGPISSGASGGLFGLLGALVVFGLIQRRTLPPFALDLFGWRLWPWVVVNLVAGAVIPGIDHLGHVGGLLTGMSMSVVVGNRLTDHGPGAERRRAFWAAASVFLLLFGFGGWLIA